MTEPTPIPASLASRFVEPRLVGGGESGSLYHVRDAETGSPGLLKILGPWGTRPAADQARLLRELTKQRGIQSGSLASIYGSGRAEEGPLWLFREWVEGESLAAASPAAPSPPKTPSPTRRRSPPASTSCTAPACCTGTSSLGTSC